MGQAEAQAFLAGFEQFSFLWRRDVVTEYAKFVAAGPVLEVGGLPSPGVHASLRVVLRMRKRDEGITSFPATQGTWILSLTLLEFVKEAQIVLPKWAPAGAPVRSAVCQQASEPISQAESCTPTAPLWCLILCGQCPAPGQHTSRRASIQSCAADCSLTDVRHGPNKLQPGVHCRTMRRS